MAALLNRAEMTTLTTGTGTLTLAAAVIDALSLDDAGAVDGEKYPYLLEENGDFEFGYGTYTASVTLFSRDTVTKSKIAGVAGTSKINLSGTAVIRITVLAADIVTPDGTQILSNKSLGSNLDANGFNIGFDDNTGILDDSGNEQLIFKKTASAVNQFEVTNAATGNAPSLSSTGGDTNIDLNLASKGTGGVKANNALVKTVGKETIWIPSGALYVHAAAPATAYVFDSGSEDIYLRTWSFSGTGVGAVQFAIAMPKSWDEGTLTAQFLWTAEGGSAGNVLWAIQGRSFSNDDPLNASKGGSQSVVDAWIANGDLHISDETSAITLNGSAAENDMIVFEVVRDATNGSDTFATAALLIGVKLHYTSNASTDA